MPLDVTAMLSDPLFQMGVNTIGQPGGFTNAIRQGVKGGISGLQQMQQLTATRRAQQAAEKEAKWRSENMPEGIDPSLASMWANGQITANEMYTQDRLMKAQVGGSGGGSGGSGGSMKTSGIWGTKLSKEDSAKYLSEYIGENDINFNPVDMDKGSDILRIYTERAVNDPNGKYYQDPLGAKAASAKFVVEQSTKNPSWASKIWSAFGGDTDRVLPSAAGPEFGPGSQAPPPPAAPQASPNPFGYQKGGAGLQGPTYTGPSSVPPAAPQAPQQPPMAPVGPQSTVDSMALQGVGRPDTMSQPEAAAQAQGYLNSPMEINQQLPEAIQQLGEMQKPKVIESLGQPSPAITPDGDMYKDSFIHKGANYALEALGNAVFGKKAEGAEADGRSYKIAGLPDNAQYNFSPTEGFIAELEGYSEDAYKDADGYSKGFGEYGAKQGDKANVKDSVDFLKTRVGEIEADLDDDIPGLDPNVKQAVTSLIYNVGKTKWGRSNARAALKRGDMKTFLHEAFDPVIGFVKSQGEINDVLVDRRQAEKAIAMRGMKADNSKLSAALGAGALDNKQGEMEDSIGDMVQRMNQYGRNEVF